MQVRVQPPSALPCVVQIAVVSMLGFWSVPAVFGLSFKTRLCPVVPAGTHDDVTWPDGWTSTTRDGKRSAQFEHTLLVTETGVEILTARVGAPTDRIVWDDAASTRPLPEAASAAAAASTAK